MYHLNLKLFSPTYLPRDFILGIYGSTMISENFMHIYMQYTQYLCILVLIKSISPGQGDGTADKGTSCPTSRPEFNPWIPHTGG